MIELALMSKQTLLARKQARVWGTFCGQRGQSLPFVSWPLILNSWTNHYGSAAQKKYMWATNTTFNFWVATFKKENNKQN